MQDVIVFVQHHWLLSLSIVIILVLLMILEFIKQRRNMLQLSPSQLVQRINHENAQVVDIRSADAYQKGHIIDAISIPIEELSTKLKKIEKFKSRPIVIVCGTGNESGKAAESLKNQGFNTYILAGGIRAWQTADMPLIKE